MMDFLKKLWQGLSGDPAPSDWDPAPVVELLLRLREDKILRANLGLAEIKTLLQAFRQGLGLEDRAALEQLLSNLLIKNVPDQAVLESALDDFFSRRGAALQQKAAAALQTPETRKTDQPGDPGITTPEPPLPTPEPPQPRNSPSRARTPVYETSLQLELSITAADVAAGLPELPGMPAADSGYTPPQGHRFIFTEDYQSVSRRQMDQIWRFLRKPSHTSGRVDEIDFPRTVERLARQGWLDQPEWQRGKFNKVRLVLLIDHGGSMTAWHSQARQLAASAKAGGGHAGAEVWWFHNLPQQFESVQKPGLLFGDPAHLKPEKMENLIRRCSKQDTEVLIFSDAGAARGRQTAGRVNPTLDWLLLLQRHVSSVAWLNPVPANRWWGNSAEAIGHGVAMFEATPRGMMAAVNHLRGR